MNLAPLYIVGEIVIWHQFASCCMDASALQNEEFMGTSGLRTMFLINQKPSSYRARVISLFSLFPHELEVLFPPNTPLKVISKLDAGHGLTIITLQEETSGDPILLFPAPPSIYPSSSSAVTESVRIFVSFITHTNMSCSYSSCVL